ncbi:MAG TPA: hypothetical protein VN213_03230, partial [Solirubrobacteraceae bacterium]|nr:hypothetical protein [Solirubrobacteraceae bacterium]
MAEKPDKPKKKTAKPRKADKSVLGALPSTRPERIGGDRGAASRTSAPEATSAGVTAASTPPAAADA